MSAFSVENPHDGKTFENYSRFEWGVEVGVVTTFMVRLFVPHEFDMVSQPKEIKSTVMFVGIHKFPFHSLSPSPLHAPPPPP